MKNVRKSNTPDYPLGDPKVDLFSFEPGSPRTTAEFTLEGDEVVLYRWQIGSPPMEIERLPLSAWLADIDFAAAKEDNEFDEDLDPPPVDEAFLLLELGWRVSCVSTASGITISTTPQDDGSVDQDNHWRSFGLEPGSSIQEQWIRPAASAEKWIRNSKSTGVIDRYGNFSEVDTEHLNILKFLLAAEWTSSSFSSDRAGWHSTNNPPARSFLTADFLAARDTNDLDIVRSRIEAVESFTRRHGMIGPLRSVRVATEYLEETGQPTIGYYLVALKNGKCYIGETVNFRSRLATHQRNFGEELRGFFVRPDRTAAKPCVPFPTRTELVSWSLSCLPGGQGDNRRSSTGVLACLSIAMTAVLTLLKDPRSDRSGGTSSLATWSWVRMTTFGSFGYSDATRGPTSSLLTTASSARESA
ncbi:GIY-YIG nuclease family protein [Gordonia paraffinivorans]|uniref:GIY-YIG nuclease family protein n=1 Tax=Gordonia paraffinivorans TaxID=175628 RepID=UPI001447A794|nr:GIY-YIG nuclease family protein [Gordonia paraffinivorans]